MAVVAADLEDYQVITLALMQFISHHHLTTYNSSTSLPTVFNWKEKRNLRIANKLEKTVTKIRASGEYADIEHLFDPSRGDTSINWDLNESYVSEAVPDTTVAACSTRKQVSMAMLFGPNKSFGLLPKRENVEKLRFSHSRVFGIPKRSQYNVKGLKNSEEAPVA